MKEKKGKTKKAVPPLTTEAGQQWSALPLLFLRPMGREDRGHQRGSLATEVIISMGRPRWRPNPFIIFIIKKHSKFRVFLFCAPVSKYLPQHCHPRESRDTE